MDNAHLTRLVALANDYCVAIQNVSADDLDGFLASMTNYLPRLYWEFSQMPFELTEEEEDEAPYLGTYMDEDYYEGLRRDMEQVLGPDDIYLETQIDDMKYSDTPIGASISQGLADIFQYLYNFVEAVRDSDGELLHLAYAVALDGFYTDWSQTLCNVMRPINRLRFAPRPDDY